MLENTSTPEFKERLESLLKALRPRIGDEDWGQYLEPYTDGVWTELLINIVALVHTRPLTLSADEQRDLDELVEAAGITDVDRDARPVEADAERS